MTLLEAGLGKIRWPHSAPSHLAPSWPSPPRNQRTWDLVGGCAGQPAGARSGVEKSGVGKSGISIPGWKNSRSKAEQELAWHVWGASETPGPLQLTAVFCLQMDELQGSMKQLHAFMEESTQCLQKVSVQLGKPVLRGPELVLFYVS